MSISVIRFGSMFALACFLVSAAEVARGDYVLQQYSPTTSTSSTAALSPKDASNNSNYSHSFSAGDASTDGESVYLPVPASGSSTYTLASFNFWTRTTNNGVPSNTPYAPTGTELYVFQITGNPHMTDLESNSQPPPPTGPTGGAYIGTPTALYGQAIPAANTAYFPSAKFVGDTSVTNGSVYSFAGQGITLYAGDTYFFYIAYATKPTTLNFEVSSTFASPAFTPYSDATSTTYYDGDQRFRAPGTNDYYGPTNSVALFTLTVTPEPGRAVGLVGMVIMGCIGLCFGFSKKRRAAISLGAAL